MSGDYFGEVGYSVYRNNTMKAHDVLEASPPWQESDDSSLRSNLASKGRWARSVLMKRSVCHGAIS